VADKLKVLMVAAEAVPYAKVGGLADVIGALPRALAELGAEVTLILPRYRHVDPARFGLERVLVPHDWHIGVHYVNHGFGLLRGRLPGSEVEVLFLENDHFFNRWSVYNAEGGQPFPDDAERWIFYQRGCLEICKLLGLRPDVVHAHDGQTGLVPTYLRTTYRGEGVFQAAATVFTIHNLAYQSAYGRPVVARAGFPYDWFYPMSPIEMNDSFNWMKAGIVHAHLVTTVSPTYSREIQTPEGGYGMDGVLRSRSGDLFGVLNGIDLQVWSPQRDPKIPRNYGIGDWNGKLACKKALLERLGLPSHELDVPLLALVGRLVPQKGCDLFEPVLHDLLAHRLRFVVLGSGADRYENLFRAMAYFYPDQVRAIIGFDDELAHWIEAGADIFLMPSQYEPCGLNQMYSMTYGTVPVVRAVGGLNDTVREVPPGAEGGTGFRFHPYSSNEFKEAIYRALVAYQDRPRWERLMVNGMRQDFSWATSARSYMYLYHRALLQARG
jgi:starch synthase